MFNANSLFWQAGRDGEEFFQVFELHRTAAIEYLNFTSMTPLIIYIKCARFTSSSSDRLAWPQVKLDLMSRSSRECQILGTNDIPSGPRARLWCRRIQAEELDRQASRPSRWFCPPEKRINIKLHTQNWDLSRFSCSSKTFLITQCAEWATKLISSWRGQRLMLQYMNAGTIYWIRMRRSWDCVVTWMSFKLTFVLAPGPHAMTFNDNKNVLIRITKDWDELSANIQFLARLCLVPSLEWQFHQLSWWAPQLFGSERDRAMGWVSWLRLPTREEIIENLFDNFLTSGGDYMRLKNSC